MGQGVYSTTGGELLFSLAEASYGDEEAHDVLRFTPVVNVYKYWHYDVSERIGFIAGLGTHNIGFITDVPASVVAEHGDLGYSGKVRKRFRNYTVGIPIGMKLGVMEHVFVYGGYEIEFPYAYKEKTYEDGEKVRKYTDWFAREIPPYYNSFFVGVQLPQGTSIKFQYYVTDFFDQDYVQDSDNWSRSRNFYPTAANAFHISISKTLFRGKRFMHYEKEAKAANEGRLAMY